jgi:hypothetical protein
MNNSVSRPPHAELPEPLPQGFAIDCNVIERALLQGPMGWIYKAVDTRLNVTIGLYVLSERLSEPHGRLAFSAWFRHAFYAERGQFYDLGEWQGLSFVTMHYTDDVDAMLKAVAH